MVSRSIPLGSLDKLHFLGFHTASCHMEEKSEIVRVPDQWPLWEVVAWIISSPGGLINVKQRHLLQNQDALKNKPSPQKLYKCIFITHSLLVAFHPL